MKVVTYYRVSTAAQGRSGLGLEAQRHGVDSFCASRACDVLAEFTEVESGKRNNRPELEKALHRAKVTGATLVIAKLDRLSRNAAFLLTLRDSGVDFIAADMPDACRLTVGILAMVAEQEREAIADRTRKALAAAKARGRRLGNPNGAAAIRRAGRGNSASVAVQKAAADHVIACPCGRVERKAHQDGPRGPLASIIGAQSACATGPCRLPCGAVMPCFVFAPYPARPTFAQSIL
jgi:DNA invertase Pin-like site-specific DNA recombinase